MVLLSFSWWDWSRSDDFYVLSISERSGHRGLNAMAVKLLNIEIHDGSRHFGDLPQTILWYGLRKHIKKLDGAKITDFVTDHVTEAWIDFSYREHQFSINDQLGAYWFFVHDPRCSDKILEEVLSHCAEPLTFHHV